jgi:hypothetical protein
MHTDDSWHNKRYYSRNNIDMTFSKSYTFTVVAITLIGIFSISLLISPLTARAARVSGTVNLTCMQTAVDTREDAIAGAFDTFNDDITAALAARKSALHSAWGLTDVTARKAAIKAAWTTWKSAHKSALKDLKDDRKAAWDTFKTTAKTTCSETLPADEALIKDSAGSISL